jgi:hypothetical protein
VTVDHALGSSAQMQDFALQSRSGFVEKICMQVTIDLPNPMDEIQYLTNDQGDRVGVVLSVEMFDRFQSLASDPNCLVGMSLGELQALSDCRLTVAEQGQLKELLEGNSSGSLSSEETMELDRLVEQTDQLSLLKTRARYTLKRLG